MRFRLEPPRSGAPLAPVNKMLIGVSLRPQDTDWQAMRDAAVAVDELGFDWLLTSDHLLASGDHEADPERPIFEAWQIVAAWAALTERVRIGVMVSGVMLRHPALLAKMAITLDHVSGGRAICGIGAGWFAGEAAMYGLDWPTRAERLDRLEEQAAILRSLFDEPRTSFDGAHYRLTDASAWPKPLRRLPLLIGGGGEQRTVRIAARYADIWNAFGSPAEMRRKLSLLHRYCEEVGRDPLQITATVALAVDPADTSEQIALRIAEYRHVGIRGVVVDLGAPYDMALLERLTREVRPALDAGT